MTTISEIQHIELLLQDMLCESDERENTCDVNTHAQIPIKIDHLKHLIENTDIKQKINTWLFEFDRSEKMRKLNDESSGNNMHIYGAGLCGLIQKRMQNSFHQAGSIFFESEFLQQITGKWYAHLVYTSTNLNDFQFEDLHNLVTALQQIFDNLYTIDDDRIVCDIDVQTLLVCILAKISLWINNDWKEPEREIDEEMEQENEKDKAEVDTEDDSENDSDAEEKADKYKNGFFFKPGVMHDNRIEMVMPYCVLRGFAQLDHNNNCILRFDAATFLFNAIHSMLTLNAMLTNSMSPSYCLAKIAEHQKLNMSVDAIEIAKHHLEASTEDWFTLSMTRDCKVGTVAQYAHKYAYLFHSISQAVYYNYPSYARRKQISAKCLQRAWKLTTNSEDWQEDVPVTQEEIEAVNLLPCLMEIAPEIHVLCEHTGAGCEKKHKNRWTWVLWNKFVMLVGPDFKTYTAHDIRTLLQFAFLFKNN